MANYIDNQKFYEELVIYKKKCNEAKELGKVKPVASNYIGTCIIDIATHYSYKPSFINYSYKDQMVSDAIEACIKYVSTFDPEQSSNPFAYFTTTCHRAFLLRIKKEKKQTKIKTALLLDSSVNVFELQEHDEDGTFTSNYVEFLRENMVETSKPEPKKEKIKKVKVESLFDE